MAVYEWFVWLRKGISQGPLFARSWHFTSFIIKGLSASQLLCFFNHSSSENKNVRKKSARITRSMQIVYPSRRCSPYWSTQRQPQPVAFRTAAPAPQSWFLLMRSHSPLPRRVTFHPFQQPFLTKSGLGLLVKPRSVSVFTLSNS